MSDPVISVVLPTYNRQQVLGRAVTSVLQQTFGDFELIVVDDGSTDGTRAVVESFRDPRVRYVRRENGGAAAARNTGVTVARAALVAFQDSDDEWTADKLEKQLRAMRAAGEETGMILCGHLEHFPTHSRRNVIDPLMARGDYRASLLSGLHYITPTWLVRKAALIRAGGFDERLSSCEDHDLALRLADVTRLAAVPEILVVKHFTPGSVYNDLRNRANGMAAVLATHRDRWRDHRRLLAEYELRLGRLLFFMLRDLGGIPYLLRSIWHDPLRSSVRVAELFLIAAGRQLRRRGREARA